MILRTKFAYFIIPVAYLALVTACSPKTAKTSTTPAVDPLIPTETDITAGKQKYADLQMTELDAGLNILKTSCTKCHKLFKPSDFSVKEWNDVLPPMESKAGLSADERNKIERYVYTKKLASGKS